MNRSKSPWVFLVSLVLSTFLSGSLLAERSLSRSKLERELKHLRESLHEAHRELAIKADRIDELSRELERIASEESAGRGEEKAPVSNGKKSALSENETKQVNSPDESGESGGEESAKKKTKPTPEARRADSITVLYDRNSAVNFEGRERILEFVEERSAKEPEASFSVKAFANDSDYEKTDRDIADNRARFLTDYLVIRGIPRDRFPEVAGEISSDPGRKGRRVVVSVIERK